MVPEGQFTFLEADSDNEPSATGLTPIEVLHRYWGYDSFRPLQLPIIENILSGKDTIGLLPTGGGKSLTFQVPALILPGVTLVVSPLISLMKDQVDRLHTLGIAAECLHSGLSLRQADYIVERLRQGRIKLLYVAPERLGRPNFVAELKKIEVSLVVVDEAHCISQWGYDFRPSYLRLDTLRCIFPDTPMLALTASATPEVLADIVRQLDMHRPGLFSLSFRRNNISFMVRNCRVKETMLLHILDHTQGSAIVYVRSRRRCHELSSALNAAGITATHYHAGMEPTLKDGAQEEWMSGNVRVMVATTAFGMGIDKPDVRLVVHFDMPSTLEEYYQEAGRAGRDNLHSWAVLLATANDKAVFARRLAAEFPPKETVRHIYDEICRYLDIPMEGGERQLYEFRTDAMSLEYGIDRRILAASLRILSRTEFIEYIEETSIPPRVQVLLSREKLYSTAMDENDDAVLEAVLRLYTGVFMDLTNVNEDHIATRCGLTRDMVHSSLLRLRQQHVIQYVPANRTSYVYFPEPRTESRYLPLGRQVYDDRRLALECRMDAMRDFVFGTPLCRQQHMLAYFGEKDAEPCGMCDICRERKSADNPKHVEPAERITGIRDSIVAFIESCPDGRATMGRITHEFPEMTAEDADAVDALVRQGVLRFEPPYITVVRK